ncbi:MAG: Mannosylfructose-phosphate synthase [Verrucomicrobiota bacterium]|jgi:glycosyltransferase involved in cell wall biosynthesis
MRSLHFVQSIEPLQGGGLGQAALGLHLAMRSIGTSKLITTCGPAFDEVPANVIQGIRQGPDAIYYSSKLRQVAASAVAEADWVHGHGFYVGTNAIIAREAVKQRKSLCYHAHGFFDPWILGRSQWKKWMSRFLFEDRNFRNVALWRALTRKEVGQIRAVGMKQPVEVLPNGIRLEEIDQAITPEHMAPFEKRLRPKRALFLGRIHPKKGLDILIDAWRTLAAKYPDWELVIVGPDEGGYLAKVEEMIRHSDVANSVQLFGSVRGAAKVAAFRSADLFVLSSYSEGFPVAVVEAAAHRLPCVITTECNFPELVEADGAWESFPSAEAFSAVLEQALAADDLERRQRGENGRALIEAHYTWPTIAKRMHDICQDLS